MKYLSFFSCLLILVTVIGCASEAPIPPPSTEPVAQIPTPETTPFPDVTLQEKTEPVAFPPEIQQILAKSANVKSYSYIYTGRIEEPVLTVYVVGDHTKVVLPTLRQTPPKTEYFDTVFLTTSTKQVVGYCLDKDSNKCDASRRFNVKYADYSKETPLEWLHEIPPTAVLSGSEKADNRNAAVVSWQEGTQKTRLWIDTYYGVPLKVEISVDGTIKEIYTFTSLIVNKYKESDVLPPSP